MSLRNGFFTVALLLGASSAHALPLKANKGVGKPTHHSTGSLTPTSFKTARAAALHTAAGQLDRAMATLQKPATLLSNRMGNPPISTTRLSDAEVSSRSPSGRAERHQVVTRMKSGPGSRLPLAKVRVSVMRQTDGSFRGYDDGSLRRVRARFHSQGSWVAFDPNASVMPKIAKKVPSKVAKLATKPANPEKTPKRARPQPPVSRPTTGAPGQWSKKVYSSPQTGALSFAASRMTPAIGGWWSSGVRSIELQVEKVLSRTTDVTRYLVATKLRNTRPMMTVTIEMKKVGPGQYKARAIGGVDVADALSGGEGTGPVGDEV